MLIEENEARTVNRIDTNKLHLKLANGREANQQLSMLIIQQRALHSYGKLMRFEIFPTKYTQRQRGREREKAFHI